MSHFGPAARSHCVSLRTSKARQIDCFGGLQGTVKRQRCTAMATSEEVTTVVTGASRGLGLEFVKQLLSSKNNKVSFAVALLNDMTICVCSAAKSCSNYQDSNLAAGLSAANMRRPIRY